MKGIVFNLLEKVVEAQFGAEVWDRLLDDSNVEGAYTSLGNYDDAEIEAIVAAAMARLGMSRADVLRWFGVNAMPILAKTYPSLFEPYASAHPFVLGVNSIIHAEVRKLYPGALCPHFEMSSPADAGIDMTYISARRMCALAEGFIIGAAGHFGETVAVDHITCVDHGDAGCRFKISWL
jgi:hypothetical protein